MFIFLWIPCFTCPHKHNRKGLPHCGQPLRKTYLDIGPSIMFTMTLFISGWLVGWFFLCLFVSFLSSSFEGRTLLRLLQISADLIILNSKTCSTIFLSCIDCKSEVRSTRQVSHFAHHFTLQNILHKTTNCRTQKSNVMSLLYYKLDFYLGFTQLFPSFEVISCLDFHIYTCKATDNK